MRICVIGALACISPFLAFGQPIFEVASVKPSDGRSGIDMKTFPSRLSATNCTLKQLVEAAYSAERVVGGPAWLNDERFDLEAKTAEDFSQDQDRVVALGRPAPRTMMLMLRSLLAERFHLKVHPETRQENVYSLVVAKNNPKLQTPQDTTRSGIFTGRTGPLTGPAITAIVTGNNASMEQLAQYLSRGRGPVVNQTGIEGKFDFRFEYAPDNSPVDSAPPFFTAIQEALGLKLIAGKGPVEYLVVDRADKPSAN